MLNSVGGLNAWFARIRSKMCLLMGLNRATSWSSGGISVLGEERRAGERKGDDCDEFVLLRNGPASSSDCSKSNRLRFLGGGSIFGTSLPVTYLDTGTRVSRDGNGNELSVLRSSDFGSYNGSSPRSAVP